MEQFVVKPKGAATRGLGTMVTTTARKLGVEIALTGFIKGSLRVDFNRASLTDLFRQYYLLHRVARHTSMVLGPAKARGDQIHAYLPRSVDHRAFNLGMLYLWLT